MQPARQWSLRSRLLAAFLLFSLLPGLGLTLFITQALPWSLERWASYGVRQTFDNALAVARDTLNRIENDLRQRWALSLESGELEAWRSRVMQRGAQAPATGGSPGADLGSRLSLDFVLLFPTEPDSVWLPAGALTRDPLIDVPSPLTPWGDGDVATGLFLRGERGELAFAERIPGGRQGAGEILAVGIYLDPSFYARLEDLNTAVDRHEQVRAIARLSTVAVYVGSAIFVVLLIGVSVVVAGRLSRSFSHPVEALAAGMNQVAAGRLDTRVEPEGNEEMRRLIDSFNSMAADLAESKAGLARAERAAAWQDAARRIAHEIRNPLQPITLALHRIDRAVADDPARREKVRGATASILEEVEALRRLSAGFSEFARMPDPEPEPLDLGAFIGNNLVLFQHPGVEVIFTPPSPPVVAPVDRHQIRQVLTNLVKNAAEAMTGGGRVWLRVDTEIRGGEPAAVIEVEDEGPGIAVEARPNLFQPYFTTKPEGTGLGLAIVERIVTAHGGRLEVTTAPGGGALFRVWLPMTGAGRQEGLT